MTEADLKKVLDAHMAWLRGKADGARADLRGADLSGANLSSADLRSAYLSSADLRSADLRRADLRGAYLSSADLRSAYLSSAYLRGAYLRGAYLRSADLRRADLRGADLSGANLSSADLRGAYLSSADLRSAEHDEKTQWPAFLIVPETGTFTGWKKLRKDAIAQLEIPAEAGRVGGLVGRKCRAEFARVVAIFERDGAPITEGVSSYDGGFKYVVGNIVRPDKYDPDFTVECSSGIHFLVTRQEAVEYL